MPAADDAGRVAQRLETIEATLQRVERSLSAKDRRPRVKIADKRFSKLARGIVEEGRTLLREDRLWTLWQAVANTRRLGLPALEAGSYRGGSAAFLAAAWHAQTGADLALDVVDTFTGHPPSAGGEHDDPIHGTSRFDDTSYDEVRSYLSRYPGITVHQGTLDKVTGGLSAPHYGLVHLDMDLYDPTIDGLRFFHGRLARGGVVILDDYRARKCPGVEAAAEEFLAEHPGYHAWDPLSEQLVLTRWD